MCTYIYKGLVTSSKRMTTKSCKLLYTRSSSRHISFPLRTNHCRIDDRNILVSQRDHSPSSSSSPSLVSNVHLRRSAPHTCSGAGGFSCNTNNNNIGSCLQTINRPPTAVVPPLTPSQVPNRRYRLSLNSQMLTS